MEPRTTGLPKCLEEHRCLVIADLDFAQTIQYQPNEFSGLIVLRHPNPTLKGMLELVRQVAVALNEESPQGRLWIVEPGRIRIHGDA